MMRTIEILLVIIIIISAFIIASFYAILPIPRRVSPINLRRLALTTLQTLDVDYDLSEIVFMAENDTAWGQLQIALSACLPPNVVYNLTVYELQSGSSGELYLPIKSISNAESLGIGSDAASYLVASSNVTFRVIPEKIGEHGGGGTLYILNCSDARGWWITGYTAHTLAEDLYNLLSPYFQTTIMIQNTTQLAQLLDERKITDSPCENVANAVIINTFGEAVPIPTIYCQGYERESEGYEPHYDADAEMTINYTRYCYTLGQKTRQFNWTWVSIAGYPFYYVSNLEAFANETNTYGIYGMQKVYRGGVNAFLQGLNNMQPYQYDNTKITDSVGDVQLSSQVLDLCNYYGIYPSPYQTSTRAIQKSKLNIYPNLTVGLLIFNEKDGCYPGALYNHMNGTRIEGSLLALGLTRTPDIRLTALGLLSYYKPRLYASEYTASNATRLVVLQLGLVGGV